MGSHKWRKPRDRGAWVPSIGTCSHTGKMRFDTRADAKRFARRQGLADLSSYQCTMRGDWHNGHLPKMIKNGDVG